MTPSKRAQAAAAAVAANILVLFVASTAVIAARNAKVPRLQPPSPSPAAATPTPGVRDASRLTPDRALRCHARVPTTSHPGWLPPVKVVMENHGDEPVSYGQVFALVTVTDMKGIVLQPEDDTAFGRPEPQAMDNVLPPHSTAPVPVIGNPQIRWTGDVVLKVHCELPSPVDLPGMIVNVPPPPGQPDPAEALQRALTTRRGLLDTCMPGADGRWVRGVLKNPDHFKFPPLTARCRAVVDEREGFDLVSFQVVAPADAPMFPFPAEPLDQWIAGADPSFPGTSTMAALRWYVVVTADGVYDDARTEAAERSHGWQQTIVAPIVTWQDLAWRWIGSRPCGSEGNSFVWVSFCAREQVR